MKVDPTDVKLTLLLVWTQNTWNAVQCKHRTVTFLLPPTTIPPPPTTRLHTPPLLHPPPPPPPPNFRRPTPLPQNKILPESSASPPPPSPHNRADFNPELNRCAASSPNNLFMGQKVWDLTSNSAARCLLRLKGTVPVSIFTLDRNGSVFCKTCLLPSSFTRLSWFCTLLHSSSALE